MAVRVALQQDVTGYTECDEEFIKSLEDTFGAVKINPADFKGYDAYFTIEATNP